MFMSFASPPAQRPHRDDDPVVADAAPADPGEVRGEARPTHHELFQGELIALIRDQNDPDSLVRIPTVKFLYEDPLVRAGLTGTLQRIADETGGTTSSSASTS